MISTNHIHLLQCGERLNYMQNLYFRQTHNQYSDELENGFFFKLRDNANGNIVFDKK